jgi:hypothetical protein
MALEEVLPTVVPVGVLQETANTNNTEGNTKMADTIIAQPQDGLMGGGTLGGLILGSMFSRNGMFGGNGQVDGAVGNSQVIQALNQQQLASATQIMTQDINRTSRDVAVAAAETQAAVASANLNQTIASLQGQTGLTKTIMDSTITNTAGHTNILGAVNGSTADTVASINNARQGISADIQNALGVLDADIHGVASQIDRSFNSVRDEISRGNGLLLAAAHSAEINGLKSSFEIQKSVTDDGDKTRAMISQNLIMDLERQLAQSHNNHRSDRTTSDLIINNNNNNNVLAQQMQQQAQQQQIATVANGLSTVLSHLNNISQVSIATGRNNTITPNAVNV